VADVADDRGRALDEIVALARRHGLTGREVLAALGEAPPSAAAASVASSGRQGVLVRVLGALGGTFVFAGICVFIALQWDSMSPAARVVVTLGSGIAAFALSLLADREVRYEKAAPPLLLIAAALEPAGLLVLFDEYGSGGDWRWASLVTCGTMAVQVAAVFRLNRGTVALFLLMVFSTFFAWTGMDLLDVDGKLMALLIGGGLLLATIGVSRTVHHSLTPMWYTAGTISFLAGLFDVVEGTPTELLFLVVAAGFVYLSVVLHSRTLLVVATAAILAYTGWYTGQYFADSVGWPVALIVFGLLMIGLSALAFRIDRDYVRSPARS
jgi:hypothetical protein